MNKTIEFLKAIIEEKKFKVDYGVIERYKGLCVGCDTYWFATRLLELIERIEDGTGIELINEEK